MPSSIQGFGTGLVGRRDFWPDGSYVTTEWIVAMFVPLIPLRSLRIKPGPLRTNYRYVIGSTQRDYVICDEQPVNVKQAACVYGFVAFYAAWIFGTMALARVFALEKLELAVVIALLAVPWLLPLYLRERAKRWRSGLK
jgi:hypothetical protein